MQILEDLLDDDADMADMYLARRAQMASTSTATATATASQHRSTKDPGTNADVSGMYQLHIAMLALLMAYVTQHVVKVCCGLRLT